MSIYRLIRQDGLPIMASCSVLAISQKVGDSKHNLRDRNAVMPNKRLNVSGIKDGVSEQRRFIQINIGSRQAGKFTPAPLRHDRRRWLRCMNASVIEPSIVNDAMRLIEARNPELMRRLFSVGAPYSGQEISYRKLLVHDTALMTTAFGRKGTVCSPTRTCAVGWRRRRSARTWSTSRVPVTWRCSCGETETSRWTSSSRARTRYVP